MDMPDPGQPQRKRARTKESSPQSQDPQEELSQVAGLVEKRRLQNRISQRNYRNKIRDRLEALEALVDRSKGEAVNVSSLSATDTPRVSTTRDGISQHSQRQTPSQGLPSFSSPPAEKTSQWDSFHEFLDGSATELDSIYDFTDLHSPAEQSHPHTMGDNRFPNSVGTLAPGILSPISTSYPTPPKASESVKSDEQPSSGNLSGTFGTLTVASESINETIHPEQQRQRQQESQQEQHQRHHGVNNRHYPVAYPSVNLPMYSPFPVDFNIHGQSTHELPNSSSRKNDGSAPTTCQRHMQAAVTYYSPPQYVWIPVPVATLPLPTPLPPNEGPPSFSRRENEIEERR